MNIENTPTWEQLHDRLFNLHYSAILGDITWEQYEEETEELQNHINPGRWESICQMAETQAEHDRSTLD